MPVKRQPDHLKALKLRSPFRSIHLHFLQNLSRVFPVLAVANIGSFVGPQNKMGHPIPVLSAWGIYMGSKNMNCGLMTFEMNKFGDRVKFVFSPDVILCG